ncbi:helix-turn-helix domain-containing protein [Marinobacter lacisalsi]|uniref:Helix-turn-helix domain-containing protein n=1 Tax=Marinobacter lacisalsi TaxID=475979 RepID=A0ABV8QBJ0_9GAMM
MEMVVASMRGLLLESHVLTLRNVMEHGGKRQVTTPLIHRGLKNTLKSLSSLCFGVDNCGKASLAPVLPLEQPSLLWHGVTALKLGWIAQTAIIASQRGVDPSYLLSDIFTKQLKGQPDYNQALDPWECTLFCSRLIGTVEDELHGVANSPMKIGTAATGLRVMVSAKSLGAAIDALIRYYSLVNSSCSIQRVSTGSCTRIEIKIDGEPSSVTSAVEELMLQFLHAELSYLLNFFLPITSVATTADFHPEMRRRHSYLNAMVYAGPRTSLAFPSKYNNFPIRHTLTDTPVSDATLFWLEHHPTRPGSQRWRADVAPVSAAVFEHLMLENLPFNACSARLGMTESQMRKALDYEGSTFLEIRREALLEKAMPLFEAGRNVDDIATELDYSDSRSLRRALRLAAGVSISDLRSKRITRPGSNSMVMDKLREQLCSFD